MRVLLSNDMAEFDRQQSYFALFGQPVSFSINRSAVQALYRELQRQVHPDRYASADSASRLEAVRNSAFVNEAYETLSSDLKRAQYLLALRGIKVDLNTTISADKAFLLQQMELRDELSEIAGSDDPEAAVDQMMTQLNALLAQQSGQFETYFEASEYSQAASELAKMHFTVKLIEETERLEAQILDN